MYVNFVFMFIYGYPLVWVPFVTRLTAFKFFLGILECHYNVFTYRFFHFRILFSVSDSFMFFIIMEPSMPFSFEILPLLFYPFFLHANCFYVGFPCSVLCIFHMVHSECFFSGLYSRSPILSSCKSNVLFNMCIEFSFSVVQKYVYIQWLIFRKFVWFFFKFSYLFLCSLLIYFYCYFILFLVLPVSFLIKN